MNKMWKLVAIGVAVHLLLLSAVFDIYFVSPIQQGMTPHKTKSDPPAKRVVLIVADGLRSSSLYTYRMKNLAPFLKSMTRKGSWGVSHTQVPTESRPGHVAILAGFNEDPSAITRGWKYNPVDFDSVINQSSNAWCWGSPDIVDIFNKDNLSHIHLSSYDPYMQDFAGANVPAKLDSWVFNKVENFLVEQRNETCDEVCAGGNIFFLHLLGLDTAGHSFKPLSKTYINILKLVDEGVKKVVEQLDAFFQDNKTAYIFTADHGMTDWGSHGAGSMHETDVPFIAWGSGIAINRTLQDIEQADIAVLISALIGIHFPVNSLGVVPLYYLNATDEQKANIMHTNALQLGEQYLTKHLTIRANTMSCIFQPFTELSEDSLLAELSLLNRLIQATDYDVAIREAYYAINLFKTGLKYYNSYYQRTLLIFVTSGFVGWIVYLFISIRDLRTLEYNKCKRRIDYYYRGMWNIRGSIVAFVIILCIMPLAYSLPINYYAYILFPIFIWCMVLSNYKHGMVSVSLISTFTFKSLISTTISYIYQIELIMLTFFHPYYLSLLFIILAYRDSTKKVLKFTYWVVGLFGLGLCPLMMYVQTRFSSVMQIAALLLWLFYAFEVRNFVSNQRERQILAFQFGALIAAFVNSLIVDLTLTYDLGVYTYNQTLSWLLLVSMVCPFMMSTQLQKRMISVIIALITPYTLMAVGYESIFMFLFAHLMIQWVLIEHKLKQLKYPRTRPLRLYDTVKVIDDTYTDIEAVKQCLYLLAFIMLSVFGTGNSASINSFDPMWTRCFITIFSPFTMTLLIFVKFMIPFLIVMCAFRNVMIIKQLQIRNTFLIILLLCDLMVIQFLYLVQNEGSWLEIGMSLSRFIVVNVTTIVLLLLYQLALFFTKASFDYDSLFKN